MIKDVQRYVEEYLSRDDNLQRFIDKLEAKTGAKLTERQMIEALSASSKLMAYNHAYVVLSGNNLHTGKRSRYYNKPKHLPKFELKLKPKKKKKDGRDS